MDVLSDNHQPIVFYHGTQRVFGRFTPNAMGLIHFSPSRQQAEEFAQHARGDLALPVGLPRVIRAHLLADRVFDCSREADLSNLAAALDWEQVVGQIEESSQSNWSQEEARRWLAMGAWQILELPCVLEQVRRRADAMVVQELGVRNVAVFSADQVQIIDWDWVSEPAARRRMGP